jgi:tetratricopeptide (TPR) repeat protein
MRFFAAPALFVCLAGMCFGGEWETANRKGTEAYGRHAWSEALAAFEASWPLCETPLQQAISANDRAAALYALDRLTEAQHWFERSVGLWGTIPGHATEMAETALGLVDLQRALGKFSTAEAEARKYLASDLPNEQKAAFLNTLGDMFREQSRTNESRTNFETTLRLGNISPARQIEAWLGLADLDRGTGNSTESIEKWNKALTMARHWSAQPSEALALRGLGLTWTGMGEFARAQPALRKSLDILEKEDAPQPRQIAAGYSCLAQLYSRQGKLALAVEAWSHALDIERKYSGEGHPETAVIMESLAGAYSSQGRFDKARELAEQAHRVMTANFGTDSFPAAGALATIALVDQREKRFDAAAAKYASALQTMRARSVQSDENTLSVMERYATVLAALHRSQQAKQIKAEIKSFRLR